MLQIRFFQLDVFGKMWVICVTEIVRIDIDAIKQ